MAVLTAAILFIVGAVPAWAITVTFVRHGQSAANASGFIDTSVPGPELTDLGRQQAADVAELLKNNGHDAIYASNMIRTQQTATPLADALDLDIEVLPGFREIGAGIFEGQSEKDGLGRIAYGLSPMLWVLGLRSLPILGAADGNAFDARVDDALQTVYDSGAEKPVVFAHGATIMFWVMMNVDNPDPLLILSHPLGNTAVVVVNGSPEEGWTLESWDGVEVPANPSLGTKLFVNVRDLITAPQTSIYRIVKALETGDPTTIATAIRDGIVNIATAPIKFVGAVTKNVIDAVQSAFPAPHALSTPSAVVAADKQAAARVGDNFEADNFEGNNAATTTTAPEVSATKTGTGPQDSEQAAADSTDTRADRAAARDERRDDRAKSALRDIRDRVKTSLRDGTVGGGSGGGGGGGKAAENGPDVSSDPGPSDAASVGASESSENAAA